MSLNALAHQPRDPPRGFASFRGVHQGETILICGCGPSLNELTGKPACLTVGVNDVGRHFDPDYLVVVNPRSQFSPERWEAIANSRARAVFSQYCDLPLARAPLVPITLGQYNGTDFTNPNVLHHTQNSPYVALCLAIYMGARRIGLIGVDFTDDHFFGATGRHLLSSWVGQIDREYAALAAACARVGVDVVTLGAASRLTAFPRRATPDFLREASAAPKLRIVSYATTPVAGVPELLARCISARTPHEADCVWATGDYGNGVQFAGGTSWRALPEAAREALAEADLVIVHNGKVDEAHSAVLAGRPVVTMAHNYIWNVDTQFVRAGYPGVVVGQYQATLPEFAGWSVVPNPVPIWQDDHRPGAKGHAITIAYTPSGRHEAYPPGHRLYWHGKGYDTTLRALDRLAARHGVEVIAVRDRQFSHAEALAAKRRAHIVIDECVTGSYHRNSLEGLSCGAVVVNGVGLLPGVADILRHCAGGAPDTPFVQARLDTLETVLEGLIAAGPTALEAAGRNNRAWMEAHWDFAAQWPRFWSNAAEAARARVPRPRPTAPAEPITVPSAHRPRVSVVIPHGGADRLPMLATTLAYCLSAVGVDEVIVVEHGAAPDAAEMARDTGVLYLFVPSAGAFNKSRAINSGSALARGDLLLWLDNDLIMRPNFVADAVDELQRRQLDCLITWTTVHLLSEVDSAAVIAGQREAEACHPIHACHTRHGCRGGAVLVRSAFARMHGGMDETFEGWGGEDDAWFHKAKILGHAEISSRPGAQLYHLHHAHSANPHYATNIARLMKIRQASDRATFCPTFLKDPPTSLLQMPVRLLAATAEPWAMNAVSAVAGALGNLGIQVATEAESGRELRILFDGDGEADVRVLVSAAAQTAVLDVVARIAPDAASGAAPRMTWTCPSDDMEVLSRTILAPLSIRAASLLADSANEANQAREAARPFSTPMPVPATEVVHEAPRRFDRSPKQPEFADAAPVGSTGGGLSVVIPFRGRERLGLLATVVANLRQSDAVDQVVIAEAGGPPVALELARRWEADYVLIAAPGPFDKARAINTGSRLARREEVLWCDCDLIFGENFLARSLREFRNGGFNFLFPYSRIEYLSCADSQNVRAGTRSPADCRPVCTLRPMQGGAIGGMGLVRAGFLRTHGGMIEGFYGWGGEDNAWIHKVSLISRPGVTSDQDQVAWHLYHADSGALSAEARIQNPQYNSNVDLLSRIQRIRTLAALTSQFPIPEHTTPPWAADTGFGFVVVAASPGSGVQSIADEWARQLRHAYGCTVRLVVTDQGGVGTALDRSGHEAIVAFVEDRSALDPLLRSHSHRLSIVVAGWVDTADDPPAGATNGPWILARTVKQVLRWRQWGVRAWHRPWGEEGLDLETSMPVLVQPLSQVLGQQTVATASVSTPTWRADGEIPVWSYWEGPLPDWIARCLETARRHVPSLRVLTASDFDALWDRDRDIDLSRLHVAQRADFVRAFLLMRHGGLWIDADCIVMRDVAPLLAELAEHEFVAHRERQGMFSNAFIAAKPGSAVAIAFYQAVCERLRARRSLTWIGLGNEPLTDVLKFAADRCLELRVEQIQPICWSRPEAYFRLAEDTEHERHFDPNAWCYMLSNQNIVRHQKNTPNADLSDRRSFFSFLLRRANTDLVASASEIKASNRFPERTGAIGPQKSRAVITEKFNRMRLDHVAEGQESISGPGSSMLQTAEIRRRLPILLQYLNIKALIDAPCGDCHWISSVRLGVETYIGVDLLTDLISRNLQRYSGTRWEFLNLNLLEDQLPKGDMILCRDCMPHFSYQEILKALNLMVASGSQYLLTTTFPQRTENVDVRTGEWRPLNLQIAPFALPAPLALINEKCSESMGAFQDKSLGLWTLEQIRISLRE